MLFRSPKGVDLGLTVRWLRWPRPEVVEVRMASASTTDREIPERIPLYRGFLNAFTFKAVVSQKPRPAIRIGVGTIVQPPPVTEGATSPAVVEGWQIHGLALGEFRVARWLALSVGYAVRALLPRVVDTSLFDPLYQVDCTASRFDIPTCRLASEGRGVPTSAGRYQALEHTLGIGSTLYF